MDAAPQPPPSPLSSEDMPPLLLRQGMAALFFMASAFCLWWITPYLSMTGEKEPYDVSGSFFLGWLLVTGGIGYFLLVKGHWSSLPLAWVATIAGQMLPMFVLPGRDTAWWALGLMVNTITSFTVVIGIASAGLLARVAGTSSR